MAKIVMIGRTMKSLAEGIPTAEVRLPKKLLGGATQEDVLKWLAFLFGLPRALAFGRKEEEKVH